MDLTPEERELHRLRVTATSGPEGARGAAAVEWHERCAGDVGAWVAKVRRCEAGWRGES